MSSGVYIRRIPVSEETAKKISDKLKGRMPKFIPDNAGRKRTLEQRERYSEIFRKDYEEGRRVNWRKGRTDLPKCSEETKEKMRNSHKKREFHHNWKGGLPLCKVCGTILSGYKYNYCSRCKPKILIGELSTNWRGGITPDIFRIRNSDKYKEWRGSVFNRDNYTCTKCGDSKGGNLNADHKIPFAQIINNLETEQGSDNLYEKALNYDQLWDIENGQTLCIICHRKTNTYGGKSRKK